MSWMRFLQRLIAPPRSRRSNVHLKAGDIVVQRGTIHGWSNRGSLVCRMLFVLIDGRHSGDVPP